MIRLGFAVRSVLRPGWGAPGRRSHLSVQLAALQDMLSHLARIDVRFYRAALDLAADQRMIGECAAQLELLAAQLAAADIRIVAHLDHGVALGAADGQTAARAAAEIEAMALLLAHLDAQRACGAVEATMTVHIGAAHEGGAAVLRFAERYRALSGEARRRLAVEHDGAGHSLGDLLDLHCRCGVAIVFDAYHWALHNPERLPLGLALGLALATWPPGRRAEVHLSSARSEAHLLPARAGKPAQVLPPRPGQHADFIDPGDLRRLLEAAHGLAAFDLMLEAKAGDLALVRLRHETARQVPHLAALLE